MASDDDDEMEFEVKATLSDEQADSDVENELSTKFGRGNSEVVIDKSGMIQVKSQRMVTGKEIVIGGTQDSKFSLQSVNQVCVRICVSTRARCERCCGLQTQEQKPR